MCEVLEEYFGKVVASDIKNYGYEHRVGSFVGDVAIEARADFVIANPPFTLALEFAERALTQADVGVALLVRSVWSETVGRYRKLFSINPPSVIAQFSERCPMLKGRWDPKARSATAYSWFVWLRSAPSAGTEFRWIPPGCRKLLTNPDDVERYAARRAPT
jgi:hypothetical protein